MHPLPRSEKHGKAQKEKEAFEGNGGTQVPGGKLVVKIRGKKSRGVSVCYHCFIKPSHFLLKLGRFNVGVRHSHHNHTPARDEGGPHYSLCLILKHFANRLIN